MGCQLPQQISWPYIGLHILPPLIIDCTTFTYSGSVCLAYISWRMSVYWYPTILIVLTVQWLYIRSDAIEKALRERRASMTVLQVIRLMALAMILTCFALGFGFLQIYFIATHGLSRWGSWHHLHRNFDQVGQFPSALLSESLRSTIWRYWSIQPAAAFVYFLLFGPTSQALGDIASGWRWLRQRMGFTPSLDSNNRRRGAQTINSFAS